MLLFYGCRETTILTIDRTSFLRENLAAKERHFTIVGQSLVLWNNLLNRDMRRIEWENGYRKHHYSFDGLV
jgi:hypothetical protein